MKFHRRGENNIARNRPAPHGAGGLKYKFGKKMRGQRGPAPHGAGGLKSC